MLRLLVVSSEHDQPAPAGTGIPAQKHACALSEAASLQRGVGAGRLVGEARRCTCRRTSGFSASKAMACVTPMSVVFLEQAVGQVGELKLRGVCGLPRPPRRRPCPQRASAMAGCKQPRTALTVPSFAKKWFPRNRAAGGSTFGMQAKCAWKARVGT